MRKREDYGREIAASCAGRTMTFSEISRRCGLSEHQTAEGLTWLQARGHAAGDFTGAASRWTMEDVAARAEKIDGE